MLTVSNSEGYEVKKIESIVTALTHPHIVHTARILCFLLYHRGQSLYCADNRGGQQAYSHGDHPLNVLRDRQQGAVAVIRGGRLSYVCIYKTHFFPHNQGETPLFVMPDAGPF